MLLTSPRMFIPTVAAMEMQGMDELTVSIQVTALFR